MYSDPGIRSTSIHEAKFSSGVRFVASSERRSAKLHSKHAFTRVLYSQTFHGYNLIRIFGKARPSYIGLSFDGSRFRRKLEDIVKTKLKNWGCGLDSSGSKQKPVMDSCEDGNEPSNSIKSGEFLYCRTDYQFLNK